MPDTFVTIATDGRGQYTEQRSRFLSFAHHCATVEEAKDIIARYARDYHDARHVCWAYCIGSGEQEQAASSDNGEPSGTAGRPIAGQIRSAGMTDIVVVVVRYFGGIKLGTSGLIVAYREAAALALESAEKRSGYREAEIAFNFPYMVMNDVMKIAKGTPGVRITNQQFDNACMMTLAVRCSMVNDISARLTDIDGLTLS